MKELLHPVMTGRLDNQQPTWRFWGEERVQGAIYSVYLKKVRYFNPSKSISNESDDEIAHLEWETVRVRMIKAGTLEKLIDSMAGETGEMESTYVNVFLATYRTFATTEQVVEIIIQKYKDLDNETDMKDSIREQFKKTLRLALMVWVDSYPEDFRVLPNYPCLERLLHFSSEWLPDNELELRVRSRLERFHREEHQGELYSFIGGGPAMQDFLGMGISGNGGTLEILPGTSENATLELCKLRHAKLNGEPVSPYSSFLDIPTDVIAEQLTYTDADLFKKVVPHHCLGAVWSRGDKRASDAASVLATIEHFNAVSLRIISTVLADPEQRPQARARIIAKWIDIAQILRLLKNFSSLKAIISGLQSNAVYRLRRTWLAVPREKVEVFEELARIFSEDNNQMAARELLMKEGTAKRAEMVSEHDRHLPKVLQRQLSGSRALIHGTVPYLGTFLTDLTMIDAAIPDTVQVPIDEKGRMITKSRSRENGSNGTQELRGSQDDLLRVSPTPVDQPTMELINFDKRRKEFEVLAQIRLLQSAANSYNMTPDSRCRKWFDSLPVLLEKESYNHSCLIEPQPPGGTPKEKQAHRKANTGHRKTDSIASSASSSSSQFYDQNSDTVSIPSSPLDSCSLERKMSTSSSASSTPSLDVSITSNNSTVQSSSPSLLVTPPTPSVPLAPRSSPTSSPYTNPDFYVIRVSLESNGRQSEVDGVNLYKSIMLSNSDRSPAVIRSAMMKHGLEGDPDEYVLAQFLPDGEMVFPHNANVYYAINTTYDLNFVLRKRTVDDSPGLKKVSRPLPGKSKKKLSLSV